MKTRSHKLLDHPIPGYIILLLFTAVVSYVIVSGIVDQTLARIIEGYGTEVEVRGRTAMSAMGVGVALGSVIAAGIFYLWFRPAFDGVLKVKDLFKGLLLLLPVAVIHWTGSFVSWAQFGTLAALIPFLHATAPGFGEEMMFRGLGVANYLRRVQTEKGVVTIFWISSIVFGLSHMMNVGSGAPLLLSVLQSLYATGVGMALGAVYLRTGNLWPCIIIHTSLDFLELMRGDLGSTDGIIKGMGAGDWITIAAGAVGCVWGLYLIRKAKRGQIVELWKNKWAE